VSQLSSKEPVGLKQGIAILLNILKKETFKRKTGIERFEIPVDNTDPLSWLLLQKNPVNIFWRDKENQFEIAGIGSSEIISSKDENYHDAIKLLDISGVVGLIREENEMIFGTHSRITGLWSQQSN
jgi:hypothetical protein